MSGPKSVPVHATAGFHRLTKQKKLAMAELRDMLDKAEEGGISNLSMDDIRTRARKRAGL